MKAGITRRSALVAGASFLGCFALGGGVRAFASEDAFVRPPGGQDTALLRALCVKCDRCRSVCPQGIIKPVTLENSVLDARTPYLDFHLGLCDFCGKCQEVCPTTALSPNFDEQTQALGVAYVNTDVCLPYDLRSCDLCEGSCPYEALSFDDLGRPHIEEARCNGCGACVDACRVNIVGFYSGHLRGIEVRALKEGDIRG